VLILATTTKAFWALHKESGRAWQIDSGNGVYYGISFDENFCYVACRQAGLGAEREPQDNAILCFDRTLRLKRILRAPMRIRDVHQIFCHEGTLYVCSTYDDTILTYSVAGQIWGEWYPFGKSESEQARNQYHINSINFSDRHVLLAGTRPHGWFARFDLQFRKIDEGAVPLGRGTHNVWEEQEIVHVCSSNEGAIVTSSGSTCRFGPKAWLRGICRDKQSTFLGISQNLVRTNRAESDCSIIRLDEGRTIERIYTFRGVGMLHDIRIPGFADRMHHNHSVFDIADHALDGRFISYQTEEALVELHDPTY
jgi:hypothetical protein